MTNHALFLHVTDPHLTRDGTPLARDDRKAELQNLHAETREAALDLTFKLLAERLEREGRKLDAILFTGDAQDRGGPGGHDQLFDMMMARFGGCGIDASKIVATPGNHDVPKGSPPGSKGRYARFIETWRTKGCVTPWLDGVDAEGEPSERMSLVGDGARWALYPLNSSNWSQSSLSHPPKVTEALEALRERLETKGGVKPDDARRIIDESVTPLVDGMLEVDVARVSHQQMEVVRTVVKRDAAALRIALIHHHLLPPGIAEELRPFADYTNLGYLRQCLREMAIDVIAHGHKHIEALSYDFVFDRSAPVRSSPHRLMTISGGTYSDREPLDRAGGAAMRLIRLSGLPGAPRVDVERIPLGVRGLDLETGERVSGRLWRTNEFVEGAPVVIQGSDIDEVYARAVQAADEEAKGAMLIVHFDRDGLQPTAAERGLPFPSSYPDPDDHRRTAGLQGLSQELLSELVSWWQLSRSNLEERIPYIHGTRLKRFAGQVDQVARIVKLLKENRSTSRGIATLIDPSRDFSVDGRGEDFASFCLVQFKRRSDTGSGEVLDCMAYYRAQEFRYWWPINVAELAHLQQEIAGAIGCRTGRITTISGDARTVMVRAPTQVAVPVIDRWLDQAPEKIAILAVALCGPVPLVETDVTKAWDDYLEQQIRSTEAFNPEGVAVAVDGLQLLATLMHSLDSEPSEMRSGFIQALRRLARSNRRYEMQGRTHEAFTQWSVDAREDLDRLGNWTVRDRPSPAD